MESRINNLIVWLIAIGLLFPLFFQLSGGIYNSVRLVSDSGGMLNQLPLPISIVACLLGIVVLIRNSRQAVTALIFIAALAIAMLLSFLFADTNPDAGRRKLLLAAQFLLPTMGLVLGQLVRDDRKIVPRAFMWILLLLVPFQLLVGWSQKTLTLMHHLYVFSIYQHFQFVPVVFVAAFAVVMAHLWDEQKGLLRLLTIVMGIYVVASASFLAIGLYAGFILVFFVRRMLQLKRGVVGSLTVGAGIVAAVLVMGLYYSVAKTSTSIADDNGQYIGKFQALSDGKMPINLKSRFADWTLYVNGISESSRTLVFGHAEPPPREVKTSAHNWYLDFAYNFGLISLVPTFLLIAYSALLAWRHRRFLTVETWWLAGLVAFLVLVDNNFKVTLRQPYPGIFAYFLWGLLLSRLQAISPSKAGH